VPVLFFGCGGLKQRVAPPPSAGHARPATPPPAYKKTDLPIAHYRDRRYYVHQVRWPNESLELIAQWYTGSRTNWKTLSRATPNLRHNRLHKGDVVFIPVAMLQIETPMPEQYVQQRRSPAAAPAPAVHSSDDDSQPQPYGPRPYPKKTSP
jgi:hypothetical protein